MRVADDVNQALASLRKMRRRLLLCAMLALVGGGLLIARLAYLQVVRHADFQAQAEDNRIALVPVPPTRGLILDRNGLLMAENVAYYTLELAPSRFSRIEQTVADLAGLVEITPRDVRRFRRLLEDSRRLEPLPIKSRLTDEEVAKIAANRYRLPGVEIRARLFRSYPHGELAGHLIGHIGRISQADRKRLDDAGELSRYLGATHIGKAGIEHAYERLLHGRPGYDEVEVSAAGRVMRTLSRRPPVNGADLTLTIDLRLQALTEQLFNGRRGALVAIEPSSGEVLAFVSQPGFDPNLFVDGIDPTSWQALNDDPDKPLLNRALRGTYPPGSTYKPFMALAALETGMRRPGDITSDPGYFQLGEHRFRDSRPDGHGSVDLHKSIVVSSDTYYYKLAYEMGVDRIHGFMKAWGFGQKTGIDLEHEATGVLPSSEWKQRRFRQKWLPGESPSIGIGQGYNAFTMLQLAHATATLANRGQPMRPRLMRASQVSGSAPEFAPAEPGEPIAVKPEHLRLVTRAMIDVNRFGTSRVVFNEAGYQAAGKTGTAQVIGIRQNEKYDVRKVAERHRDHSLFIAFAPAVSPKIALAVIVENGGFGAQAAAPIARAVFDFHLLGRLPPDRAGIRLPPIDESELRDVPEDLEPERVSPASGTAATGGAR
ncbi:MAG: penicillin-binding protein 2 [Betaproteobacteria bacterium]